MDMIEKDIIEKDLIGMVYIQSVTSVMFNSTLPLLATCSTDHTALNPMDREHVVW